MKQLSFSLRLFKKEIQRTSGARSQSLHSVVQDILLLVRADYSQDQINSENSSSVFQACF